MTRTSNGFSIGGGGFELRLTDWETVNLAMGCRQPH